MRRLALLFVVCSLVACGGSPRPATIVEQAPPPPPDEVADTKVFTEPEVTQPAPAVATPAAPCWDGNGPAIEGATTEVFPAPTTTKGYPAKIAVPDAAERTRRAEVLATRNRGFVFTLGETGDVTAITATRISCASQTTLATPLPAGKRPQASPDDLKLLAELAARNPDVLVAGSLGFGGFVQATDGSWSMQIPNAAEPAYRRIASTLRATMLSDDRVIAAFNKISKLQRVHVSVGDSCGPECGPPPTATTVLGSRAITRADAVVERYTAVYLSKGSLIIRKVAGLQLTAPGTQLSNDVKLVDAVTGAKVSFEMYDMFE